MSLIDWLASPDGILLTHAVVLLMVAVTAFLQARTHQRITELKREVDGKQDKGSRRTRRKAPLTALSRTTDVGTE